MRYAKLGAIFLFTAFAGSAWAQSTTPQTDDARAPDMQADTIEGQNAGASAQYEMSSEDGQASDDVDAGDTHESTSQSELTEGTLQDEQGQDEDRSQKQD